MAVQRFVKLAVVILVVVAVAVGLLGVFPLVALALVYPYESGASCGGG